MTKLVAWWDALPPQTKREVAAECRITLPYLAARLRDTPAKLTLEQVKNLLLRADGELMLEDFLV
jgi:hypothetical protein